MDKVALAHISLRPKKKKKRFFLHCCCAASQFPGKEENFRKLEKTKGANAVAPSKQQIGSSAHTADTRAAFLALATKAKRNYYASLSIVRLTRLLSSGPRTPFPENIFFITKDSPFVLLYITNALMFDLD